MMLNFARVIMILSGILSLPAVMCSGVCSGLMSEAAKSDPNAASGAVFWSILMYLSFGAAIGSIVVGSMAKSLGKQKSGIAALVFSFIFALLILQMNMLGLFSGFWLLVAAIMIFVAPEEQFRNVVKVEVQN